MVDEEHKQTPIGVITEVHGPVAIIACDTLPLLRQALSAHFNHETYLFEVHRVTHLEGTVKHLDDESAEMARRSNTLRQEEIVEEIEVILLSAVSLGEQREK